jgi:glucoside 3-dehydrogenase (cytochrome c) hitch-hiker subunit
MEFFKNYPMNRREAFKKIGFTTGLVVLTPSMIRLFQSCTEPAEVWTPVFLSQEQGVILKGLVDVILPKSDTPSASEVKVPEFMDRYFDEVLDRNEQQRMKMALDTLAISLASRYTDDVNKLNEENYKDLLDRDMISEQTNSSLTDPMPISELLSTLKWMTINAYRISETVGENILAYDPVPGAYYCDDLQKLTGGKAWSL